MLIEKMTNKGCPDKLVINVGGVRHKTQWSTLEKIQGTRLSVLAKLKEHDESYDPIENEYFFDRNPDAFLSILEYYRTDELHMADNICGNAMKKELRFWGLYETEIEACCWGDYSKFLDHRETLANLDTTFGDGKVESSDDMKSLPAWKRYQMIVWNHLEYPSYSRGAKALMFISISVVMVSILSFVCESHFWFQVLKNDTSVRAEDPELFYATAKRQACCQQTANTTVYPDRVTVKYLSHIDWGCLAFFSVELMIRLLFAPSKCDFIKSPLNVIDIICIVPQVISITLEQLGSSLGAGAVRAGDILKLANILRTVRVLRIFKLMKHYSAFRVLAYTIKVSTKELLLMVVFLMSGVMIFASVIHYAEPENFTSIPLGIWWALVTMTTVGYGDRVPNTPTGYFFGCLCVIGGVLVIAFTVPIVVNNFTLYYSHANSRAKLPVSMRRNKEKKPKMVAVSPTFNNISEQDLEIPMPTGTEDLNISRSYENNLNIDQEEDEVKLKPAKLTFQTPKGSATFSKPLVSPKVTNQHEEEARHLVNTLQETSRIQLNERRRQYMMALKRNEERKKDEKYHQDNSTS